MILTTVDFLRMVGVCFLVDKFTSNYRSYKCCTRWLSQAISWVSLSAACRFMGSDFQLDNLRSVSRKRYLRLSYISLWKFPCIKGRKRRPKREGPFYGRIVYPCGKATSTTVTTKKHATHSSTCNGYQNRGTVVLSVVLYIFHQRSDFLPPVLLQPTRIGHSPWYT